MTERTPQFISREGPKAVIFRVVLRFGSGTTPAGALWRIVGECRKLGVTVSRDVVSTILRRYRGSSAPRRGGPSWTLFLRAWAASALACDFLTVETVGLTNCTCSS